MRSSFWFRGQAWPIFSQPSPIPKLPVLCAGWVCLQCRQTFVAVTLCTLIFGGRDACWMLLCADFLGSLNACTSTGCYHGHRPWFLHILTSRSPSSWVFPQGSCLVPVTDTRRLYLSVNSHSGSLTAPSPLQGG